MAPPGVGVKAYRENVVRWKAYRGHRVGVGARATLNGKASRALARKVDVGGAAHPGRTAVNVSFRLEDTCVSTYLTFLAASFFSCLHILGTELLKVGVDCER